MTLHLSNLVGRMEVLKSKFRQVDTIKQEVMEKQEAMETIQVWKGIKREYTVC